MNTVLWTAVSISLVVLVTEVLNWRYHLMDEIFKERQHCSVDPGRELCARDLLHRRANRDSLSAEVGSFTPIHRRTQAGNVSNPTSQVRGSYESCTDLRPEDEAQIERVLDSLPLRPIYHADLLVHARAGGPRGNRGPRRAL